MNSDAKHQPTDAGQVNNLTIKSMGLSANPSKLTTKAPSAKIKNES